MTINQDLSPEWTSHSVERKILTAPLLFSRSVMSNSLWPQGLQHARLLCPSPSPRVGSNFWPLSQWCHPTISFSITLFSSFLQSFPASGSSPMSQFFTWPKWPKYWSQFFRWPKYWSFSFSISPSNEYSRLISIKMDWLDLLAVQGTLKSLLQYHSSKASINSSALSFFLWCNSHIHTWILEKSWLWLDGPLLYSNVSAF